MQTSTRTESSSMTERAPTGPVEFAYGDNDFRRIADLLRNETGIDLAENKAPLVYSRLAKRLRKLGIPSFMDYYKHVASEAGRDERNEMFAALTTNVTRFFREPHHFEHLRQVALPPLLEAAKKGARIRVWSSASSSGEEPYSIALEVLSLMPDAERYDIKILATDINPEMIATGKNGVYPAEDTDDIPPQMMQRWFQKGTEGSKNIVRASSRLRSLITFRELNLIGAWPMKGPFQIIFCRNVVIYFNEQMKSEIWRRLADLISDGGYLYSGHSERVTGPAAAAVTIDGVTIYRKTGNTR